MDSLRAAFNAYLQLIASKTERLRTGPQSRDGLALVLNPEAELRRVVESLETGAEFGQLVRLCQATFSDGPDSLVEERVKRFFRWSDAYCRYLSESETEAASLFVRFQDAFKQLEMVVQYLAPLECVSFSRDLLCGSFSIQHFSRERLEQILRNAVRRVFYEAADTERLSGWFLVAHERQPAHGPSYVFDMRDFDPVVSSSYTPPPRPIETALRVLSLFDWDSATTWSLATGEAWGRFRVPFWITLNDTPLHPTDRIPDRSRARQAVAAHLDEGASAKLEQFSRETGSILESYPESHPWHFFEIAITYLVRAFQTDGLDQCLWHMVAIEALVGEKGDKLSQKMAKRLGRMLGSDKLDREDIERQFKGLYNLRCDMVHGRSPGEPWSRGVDAEIRSLPGRSRIGFGSLRGEHVARVAEIRQRARQATLWFARWLNHLRRTYSPDASLLPTQRQLLSVLDSGKSRSPQRQDLQQIEELLKALPEQFPNVRPWRE